MLNTFCDVSLSCKKKEKKTELKFFSLYIHALYYRYVAKNALRSLSTTPKSWGVKSVISQCNIPPLSLVNEPLLTYEKGSTERKELEKQLKKVASTCEDIPIVIGDEEIRTNSVRCQVMPHAHAKNIAAFYYADKQLIQRAISVAVEAQKKWDRTSFDERIRIWNRAADLMAGKYRQELNATTMLGQSKTMIQAEIDAAAELIDFIRMNTYYLRENLKYQPISENVKVTKNSLRYRGIDGFIAAVSPFNFTAIGGNLAYTPALMVCLMIIIN